MRETKCRRRPIAPLWERGMNAAEPLSAENCQERGEQRGASLCGKRMVHRFGGSKQKAPRKKHRMAEGSSVGSLPLKTRETAVPTKRTKQKLNCPNRCMHREASGRRKRISSTTGVATLLRVKNSSGSGLDLGSVGGVHYSKRKQGTKPPTDR